MAHCPIGENCRKCYSPAYGGLYRVIRGLGRHPPFGGSRGRRAVRSVSLRVVRISQAQRGTWRHDSIGSRSSQFYRSHPFSHKGSRVVATWGQIAERGSLKGTLENSALSVIA